MAFHKYGSLILDVERVFAIDVLCNSPLCIRVLFVGAKPEEFVGEAAELLLEDAMTWLDRD